MKSSIGGVGAALLCTLGLAGCGSSASSSAPPTSSASHSSGSSATSGSATTTTGGTQSTSFPSVSALSSFTNYTFTQSSGGGASFTVTGRVYDEQDYETEVGGSQQYFINGTAYTVVGSAISQSAVSSPTDVPPLGGYATEIGNDALKAGDTVKNLGSCQAAGHQGILWSIGLGNAVVSQQLYKVCTDAKSGGLLSVQAGGSSGGAQGTSESFALTSIGSVGPIAAP
jgi:hypothetical protein